MKQGIVKGDALQRMAGISFLIAFALTIQGSLMYPRASDPNDAKVVLESINNAGTGMFRVTQLVLAAGIWAIVIGTAGIYRSITTGGAAAWSRLGFYGILIGAAIWTTVTSLNIGLSQVLDTWAKSSDPDKAQIFLSASSIAYLVGAQFSMAITVIWLALAFLAVGMILGSVHPWWLGWSLLALGILIAIVGFIQALTGITALLNVLFSLLAGLTSLWSLIMGIWLLRKFW